MKDGRKEEKTVRLKEKQIEDEILKYIYSENFENFSEREILEKLYLKENDKKMVKLILKNLIRKDDIYQLPEGKYARISQYGYLEGKYMATEKGFGFVSVDLFEKDVYILKENINNALNGDIVKIKILKEECLDKKAEGKIVEVIKRRTNKIIGRFESSKQFGFVVPDDNKITNDIFISKTNIGKAKNNDKVVVEITIWPQNGKKAEGKIIEVLGKADDPKLDYLSVVNMFGLDLEFEEKVLKEAKNMPQQISDEDFLKRKDLTEELIFTIDSSDTKDIDDAISIKKLDNGIYELGVHIADVSNYVKEGTNIDNEAVARGTSVYLINKVIPMLPKELSNGICSLNENVNRCALSIVMQIDEKGKVISHDIFKSVICSKKKGVYSEINKIVANDKDADYEGYKELIDSIKLMNELRQILFEKRKRRGAVEFDLCETKIYLNEVDKAIEVGKREIGISESIIEEFMLAANETIAEIFCALDAPFIYRVHEEPEIEKVNILNKVLSNIGLKVKGLSLKGDVKIHSKTMQEILELVQGKENGKMISNVVLRSMALARYSEENLGHFGLAAKYYCHFTSPIRRYPDLFIHRVISQYIKTGYNLSGENIAKYSKQAIEYSKSSSDAERNSEKAEREFEDIKMCEYMEDKIGEKYEGIISGLASFGMFVELENTIEGLVRYNSMTDDYYDYDEENLCIVGRNTHKKYVIGNKVNIKVVNASKAMRHIDFEII